MYDGEFDTPYRKPANKARPAKGCPGNSGKEHFYTHDRMVFHSGNSANATILWERNMRSFCMLCGKEKRRAAVSELDKVVHVCGWTPEEKEGRPDRNWNYRIISIEH